MAEETEGTERTSRKGTKKRFLKGSEEHKKLVELIEEHEWYLKAELPRGHEALKNFMQQTGFNRTQVKRKFQDYIAEKAGLPPAKKLQLTVKPEDFQVPETPNLLEELWQTDEIQGRMSGKCLGAEYLPKVLNQTSLWNKLRSQIMSKVASHLKRMYASLCCDRPPTTRMLLHYRHHSLQKPVY